MLDNYFFDTVVEDNLDSISNFLAENYEVDRDSIESALSYYGRYLVKVYEYRGGLSYLEYYLIEPNLNAKTVRVSVITETDYLWIQMGVDLMDSKGVSDGQPNLQTTI